MGKTEDLTNATIAERLEAFATMLDLAGARPYSARAYRRAADLIRTTRAPVADLVRRNRVTELRGIGPSIARRLGELVETGRIGELAELEQEVSPEVVGYGRYLGLTAKRALQLARALDVSTAAEFRSAIEDGRARAVAGVGPRTERLLRERIAAPPRERKPPVLLDRARVLLARVAGALEAVPAGDVRRSLDAPERLALVRPAEKPAPVIAAFARLPEIVTLVDREERRAVGVTVEGTAVELVVAEPAELGTALVRATGAERYVAALEPLPQAASEAEVYARLGIPFCPPELREEPFRGEPPALLELADLRGDLHCHTTWSDGRASVLEMAIAARERGYEYVAICDHTPNVRVVAGVGADDLRRQADEIAAANEALAPFRVLRGVECDILPDGSLDLPDDALAELDWVTASVHAGQRQPAGELTKRVADAMRHPAVRALSHPTGRLIGRRPPNALDLERAIELALETGVALEVNGLPDRLDLKGEHVRLAVDAGAKLVVCTDAHSTAGLANVELAVGTARRGWATAADVVNTLPLADLLR
ncbi:MAG: PHP domain-containing protein [Actinomycetota bacterium]|nr:PHP domain-containing protein [Actinomycetota bacterium]